MFYQITLPHAALNALVALSEVLAPGSELRGIGAHVPTLVNAREDIKDALLSGGFRDDVSPLAVIDALAHRLTLDPATRELGDRIQQIVQPALIAPVLMTAE